MYLYQGTTLVGTAATVDTYAASAQYRQLVHERASLDPTKPYKLVVEVLGTSGGRRVDVDSFVMVK